MTADPTPDVARTYGQLLAETKDQAAEIERLQTALEHVLDAGSYVDALMIAEGALSDDR